MNVFLLDQDTFFICFLIAIIVLIIILRGLLKNYIISKFMCALFSLVTIVLAVIVIADNTGEKMSELSLWILYTTFSSMMYSFGPEVFVEDLDYKIEFHEWLTTSFFTIEKRRTTRIAVYFIMCGGLSFITVNLVGYQGQLPEVFLVIPGICLLISVIKIIKWFKD